MNSYFNPKDHRIKKALKSVQSFLCEYISYKLSKYQTTYKKNHTINRPKKCPKYHAQKCAWISKKGFRQTPFFVYFELEFCRLHRW